MAVRRLALAVAGAAALFAAGCAPYIQPWEESYRAPALAPRAYITADGARLPSSRWLPPGPPRAVIIAVHGFADYRRTFAAMAPYLARHGIAVYAYDQRGFGGAPHPGVWPGLPVLAEDLRRFSALMRRRYPGTPLYWLGHSMGAAVVICAAYGPRAPRVDGLILDAPAVWGGGSFNLFYRMVLWAGAHTVPWLRLSGTNLHIQTTDNIKVLRALAHDPYMQRNARIDELYEVMRLMDRAQRLSAALMPPALVQYGAHDEVIPRAAVCAMLSRMQNPTTVALYPRGYHLLLRDVDAGRVWADIVSWVTRRRVASPADTPRACRGGAPT